MMKKKYRVWSLAFAFAAPLALLSPSTQAVTILNVADPGTTDVLFTGPTAYQQGNLGYSQAVGDFNGDGVDDLVLGAPGMSHPQGTARVGRVHMFYGGAGMALLPGTVTTQDGAEDALLYGTSEKERAGDMMAVGDFNGDGVDDLVVVGQLGLDNAGTVDVTRIYVVYGHKPPELPITGSAALLTAADTLIQRSAPPPSGTWPDFQVSALATGDLNNDTYDDLIISDKVNNEFRIFMGQAAKWATSLDLQGPATSDADFVLKHSADTNPFSVAYFPLYNQSEIAGVAAGDLNGDNTDDLAMGLPNEDLTVPALSDTGRVYVIFGGANFNPAVTLTSINIDTAKDILISGGQQLDKIGGPLVFGDINNDTYDDLVIGEPLSMQGQISASGLGQVQVVFGGNMLATDISLFTGADITLRLAREDDEGGWGRIGFKTGQALLATDANGDGIDDLAIGSPGAFYVPGGDNGWVHMVYGAGSMASTYLLDQAADAWFETPAPTDPLASGRMGESIALGDFDNDGRPDIAMGAPDGSPNGVVSQGFIPLLFKPASTVACSGFDAEVTTDYPFSDGDFLCVGDNSLATVGGVVIQSTATAHFRSPAITLGNGFKVETGAEFIAGI